MRSHRPSNAAPLACGSASTPGTRPALDLDLAIGRDPYRAAGQRQAGRADPLHRRAVHGERTGGLGHPPALHEGQPRAVEEVPQVFAQRRATADHPGHPPARRAPVPPGRLLPSTSIWAPSARFSRTWTGRPSAASSRQPGGRCGPSAACTTRLRAVSGGTRWSSPLLSPTGAYGASSGSSRSRTHTAWSRRPRNVASAAAQRGAAAAAAEPSIPTRIRSVEARAVVILPVLPSPRVPRLRVRAAARQRPTAQPGRPKGPACRSPTATPAIPATWPAPRCDLDKAMLIAFLATITCRLCSHDEHHLACLTSVVSRDSLARAGGPAGIVPLRAVGPWAGRADPGRLEPWDSLDAGGDSWAATRAMMSLTGPPGIRIARCSPRRLTAHGSR